MAELTILTGASRGMGLAMAEQLCTPGRTMLCIARGQSDSLSALARSHGTALTQWQADLSRPQAVAAPMLLTQVFLQLTRPWPARRRVLQISSGLGRRAMAASAVYCATKAGLDHFSRCVALDEALLPNPALTVCLAPGVIDTDMQTDLRNGQPEGFPDRGNFVALKESGSLASPAAAAQRVLAYLARDDFGSKVVADVRD